MARIASPVDVPQDVRLVAVDVDRIVRDDPRDAAVNLRFGCDLGEELVEAARLYEDLWA